MTASRTGCQTCKDRRVKCDEAKPLCQRCLKSRRICMPRDAVKQTSFPIHLENDYASGENKRPRGPRSSWAVRKPPVDLETKALTYYLRYHICDDQEKTVVPEGLSVCVESWRASGRKDSMIDLALTSIALAVYANTQQDPEAGSRSSSKYNDLLRVVQDRIARVESLNLDENDIDACLLTIFIMGRYEGTILRPEDTNPKVNYNAFQSWSHHEGAMAVLKVWYDNFRSTTTASDIVKHTRRGQIRSAIIRSRLLPDWILDGRNFGEQDRDLVFDRIVIYLVVLREKIRQSQSREEMPLGKLGKLREEVLAIEDELQSLIVDIACDHPRQQHILPIATSCLPREHFYSQRAYSCRDRNSTNVWLYLLATRVLISSTHLKILQLGQFPSSLPKHTATTPQSQRTQCINQLDADADDLAAMIPFCLERFSVADTAAACSKEDVVVVTMNENSFVKPVLTGGLVWALTVVSSIDGIDPDRQSWFRSEMMSCGEIMGSNMIAKAYVDWTVKI